MMERRRRQGNDTPLKNSSIENIVRHEENEYPVTDPNKTVINELNDALKKISQRVNHGRHH
jgi:hypothetical protein